MKARRDELPGIYELRIVRERRSEYRPLEHVRTSQDLYRLFRERFEKLDREEFLVVPLDAKHRVLGFSVVSVGSLTASIVHPREVLKLLVLSNAAAFICLHQHPSGDPSPSPEDVELTRRLREIADLVGVRLLDHVIFGDGTYLSFADRGML
ncbi:MAG: JAB domain-containing protein [bacterium]